MNELDIFVAALAIPDPQQRAEYLQKACPGDSALQQRIEILLAGNEQSQHILNQPLIVPTLNQVSPVHPHPLPDTSNYLPQATVGTLIAGKYKLLQQIGEGGMGRVWMADQIDPIKRRVAVKLIRAERGTSKTILARFEAERQAIALMDHPNIAKLLDAGTSETGQPFFVMELVKGIPLNEYCDTHRLNISERLTLFMQICLAVQHAHQKGIIHRDLKPTNILVESHDGKAVPKVIDFGLAKATTGLQLTDHTLFTVFGSVLGTPLYMAPEQANFNAIDVDTRADIYALGVILYELLTGSTPLTRDNIKQAAWDEMLKLIREQEAPTPSSRLSSSNAIPSIAVNRQSEPQKLGRFVKGELDWIVMKALDKERDRRYETANGFAKDIERFLNQEAVSAGPPTTRYRVRKFVQRHRPQVIAVSLIVLTLIGGIIGTTWGLIEAKKQERSALLAREAESARAEGEREAKEQAEAKRQEAEQNLGFANKSNEILGSVFANLNPKANYATVAELTNAFKKNLKQAVRELEGSAIGDPLVVAKMQNTLAASLLSLGDVSSATLLLEKALDTRKTRLGPNNPYTLTSMNNLALCYQQAGKFDLALPLFEKVFQEMKASADPDTLISMSNLAGCYRDIGKFDLALPLQQEALRLWKAKFGSEHPETLLGMNNLALCYHKLGKFDLALPLFEQTLQLRKTHLGSEHPDTLFSMSNLAGCYRDIKKFDLALSLYEQTLPLQKAKLGSYHPDMLRTMGGLGMCYKSLGKFDLALPLYEQTFQLRKTHLGPEHPETLGSMNNLASYYREMKKFDLALPLYEQTLQLRKTHLGPEHPDTLNSIHNLAVYYLNVGKFDLGLPLLREALRLEKVRLGPEHPDTLTSMKSLANGFSALKQFDESILISQELLTHCEKKWGRNHPETLHVLGDLGNYYRLAGRITEAIPLLEEAYQKSRAHSVGLSLMASYDKAGKSQEISKLADELVAQVRNTLPRDSKFARELAAVGRFLIKNQLSVQAEPLLRECLAIREKTQPDHWNTFNSMSFLGGSLLGQKKYTEAEPFLLKGYEGMKARQKTIPSEYQPRLPEALDRLIHLYKAMHKPDEVKKYQELRAKYPPEIELLPMPRESQ